MSARKSDSLLSGIAYLGTARALVLCMNLVGTSRLAHALGATNFGINSFAVSYVAYFLIVVNLGYETFVTREIARDATRLRRLVDSMVTMRLLIGTIVAFLLIASLFLLRLSPIGRLVILIQGIGLFSSAIALTCVYQGLQQMRVVATREFLASLINMTGILWLVHTPADLVLAACVSAATVVLTNVPILVRYTRDFGLPRLHVPQADDWRTAHTSMAYFWSVLMITITYNIHIVLLGLLRNDTDVGLFSAGWKLFNFAVVVPNLISTLFLPRIANLTARPAERMKSTEIYMQTIIVCAVPVTMFGMVLIPQILMLLFGPAYLPASRTAALLLLNAMVVALTIGFGTPLVAVGRQKAFLRVVACGAAVGVLFNLILIPRFGPEGAAIGTLLDELTVLGVLVWDRPEVSVGRTSDFALRCLVAVVPAAFLVHLVTRLPMVKDFNLAVVVLAGLAGTMTYLLVLRLMRIDFRQFASGLRTLQ